MEVPAGRRVRNLLGTQVESVFAHREGNDLRFRLSVSPLARAVRASLGELRGLCATYASMPLIATSPSISFPVESPEGPAFAQVSELRGMRVEEGFSTCTLALPDGWLVGTRYSLFTPRKKALRVLLNTGVSPCS